MKGMDAERRKLPRALVVALTLVMSTVTLGCILMLAAAQWDRYVLVPIGAILMAGGCIVGGIIVAFDRGLPVLLRAVGATLSVAGLVAVAATIRWMVATWHRF